MQTKNALRYRRAFVYTGRYRTTTNFYLFPV